MTDFGNRDDHTLESFDFEWDISSALLAGGSAIDLGRLDLRGEEDARAFLNAYGFDPDSSEGQQAADDLGEHLESAITKGVVNAEILVEAMKKIGEVAKDAIGLAIEHGPGSRARAGRTADAAR